MTVRPHRSPAQIRGIAAQRRQFVSVQREWTLFKPVRTLALLPIRSPARRQRHHAAASTIDLKRGDQRFLSHRRLRLHEPTTSRSRSRLPLRPAPLTQI